MYLIEEKDLRTLAQGALAYDALEYEGVGEWPRYYDALTNMNVIRWNEEEGEYVYTEKVDELMRMYGDVECTIINDLLDLMSLIDHKISIYEQKTTQFADGSASALIFVREKLKEIMNEYQS